MTLDERMNQFEDTIKKLKDTINHNNKVALKVKNDLDTKIAGLQKRVHELESNPQSQVAFGDIINNAMKKAGKG
jgi:archaellum component FlaC